MRWHPSPEPEPTPNLFQADPEDNPINDFNGGASVEYKFYYLDGATKKPLPHGTVRLDTGRIPNGGSIQVDITGATITGGGQNYYYTSGGIAAMSEFTWIHNGIETFGYLSIDAQTMSQIQIITGE